MRVLVVASAEPEHLARCLHALLRWVERGKIIVFNNATRPESTAAIDEVAAHVGLPTLRVHDLSGGEDSIAYINLVLRAVCQEHPDEVILKLDEDVVLISEQSRFTFEPGMILVPGITINNYTMHSYLEEFWPDLAEELADHPTMWHAEHPVTGVDYRYELFKRLYTLHPKHLVRHCQENGRAEVIGAADWDAKHLMADNGISITAIAFHAADYTSLVEDTTGVDEILIASAVKEGRLSYRVDHGIFCHHINYFSVRPLVQANARLVDEFVRRVFEHHDAQAAARLPRSRRTVELPEQLPAVAR